MKSKRNCAFLRTVMHVLFNQKLCLSSKRMRETESKRKRERKRERMIEQCLLLCLDIALCQVWSAIADKSRPESILQADQVVLIKVLFHKVYRMKLC